MSDVDISHSKNHLKNSESRGVDLSKIADLHMHLGSATTAHLLWEMAHSRGIRLPEKNYWKFLDLVKIDHKIDFASYHHYFDLTQEVQSTPDSIEQSVHEAISLSYRKANVNLLEIRFNPMRRNNNGLYDLDRIIFGAIVGLKRACMIYPVKAGLIIETDRRFPLEQNQIILEKAVAFKNEGIVGVDVSGPNADNFSFKEIAKSLREVKENGLGVTVHTGEAQPVEEMWEVVNEIKPDRIGHGVKAIEDPKLMETLEKENICLEVCPTSNITLNVIPSWKKLDQTLQTFRKFGVKYTINSDGPVFFNTNAKKELTNLLERKILSPAQVKEALANSRRFTFI